MTAAPTGYSAHQRRVFQAAYVAALRTAGGDDRLALDLAHIVAACAPKHPPRDLTQKDTLGP